MKFFLPIFLLIGSVSFSQSADFLVLKKKGKTLRSYYAGSNIAFQTNSGAFIDAYINAIKNDTLYLQEFLIQQLPSRLGGYYIDTVGSYHYKFHYNQLASLGHKPQKGFDIRGSGASLMGGGVLLTLASVVVLIADPKKFSPALMAASAGLAGAGYLMSKRGGKPIDLGKKYQLIYMNMGAAKKSNELP